MESSSVGRRRFLKYLGAGAIAVAGAGSAYYLYNTSLRQKSEVTTPTTALTASSTRQNYPPIANFRYEPRYINPTDQQMVQFTNLSEDPDGDPLRYQWLIDNQPASEAKDYSTKLPAGEHQVKLEVSDNVYTDVAEETVPVDPADLDLYPKTKLRIPIKGVNIGVECSCGFFPPVEEESLLESLTVARNDLGCNGVRLTSDKNDRLLSAVQIAKDLRFRSIMCSPRYVGSDLQATIDLISPFAEELESMRDDSVILNIGNELSIDAHGLIPGETYDERVAWFNNNWNEYTSPKQQDKLNTWLRSIIKPVRAKFGGKITYSAQGGEEVRWSELGFDAVSKNDYYSTYWDKPEDYVTRISNLCALGKPTYNTEWGYFTFEGSQKFGGAGWAYINNPGVPFYHGTTPVKYSQEAQAEAIDECMRLLNRTRLEGIYLYVLIENPPEGDIGSASLLRFNDQTGSVERKRAFYKYKSYMAA